MHILQFSQAGRHSIGVRVDDTNIINLNDFSPDLPADVCSALCLDHNNLLTEAVRCLDSAAEKISVNDVTLLPPITKPGNNLLHHVIIVVGLNYKDHCVEVKEEIPTNPVVLCAKFSSCVTTSGEIPIPSATKCLDYECELAVVVAKKARNVKEENAMEYVFGYTAANDVSARDLMGRTKNAARFLLSKSLDNFCPLSSDIVTKDEVEDVHNLNISSKVNGEVRQKSNTNQMIFKIPQIISFLSGCFTLLPGDIILTGTPGGTGKGFNPPKYLQSGDMVTIELQNIGTLTNTFL
ncbi:FAHD2A [Bugula neritina]|uniref:FAHD2A n=1 Tax=Bugula neritina TaxID=10212 RepID=A0A7J7JYV5_BUGNE|nr:FAHD2A [Bugula neritina]